MDGQNKWDVLVILEKFLLTKDEDEREGFKDKIMKYFHFESNDEFEHRLKNNKGKKRQEAAKRDFKMFIRQLHWGFNMPFKDYLERSDIFTKHSPRTGYLQQFKHLGIAQDPLDVDIDKFVSEYKDALKDYIEEAKDRIWVYEILEKGRKHKSGQALKHYSKAHEKIFDLIEKQIQKSQKKSFYKRFLVLPYAPGKRLDATENVAQAIIECSLAVFEHMCRCIQLYPSKSKFYVIDKPSYVHHFGILDSEYLVSEYYRYNSKGDLVPNLLFVESVNNSEGDDMKQLLDIYERQFNKFTDTGIKLDRHIISKALDMASNKVMTDKMKYEIQADQDDDDDEMLNILSGKEASVKEKVAVFLKHFPA